MTTIEAGTRVRKGYYFGGASWTVQAVAQDGTVLPGDAGERYLRVPLPVVVAIAPLLGALFVVFLPCLGFVLAAQAAARPVVRLFAHSATEIAATMQPGWQPGEAHLTGKRAAAASVAPRRAPAVDPLDELASEIAALRSARRRAAR